MNYLSVKQTATKWGMSPRRVQILCNEGRIDGAQRVGNSWVIPTTAAKPEDGRKRVNSQTEKMNSDILIERVWAMPNKNTFDIKPINDLIKEELTDGLWIDPFANKNKFASITNDLNPIYDTDYHLDALDFLKLFDDESVDGILYDPPYSPRQVSECYNDVGYNVTWDTTKASFWANHKKEISRILRKGGKVLTFGWNSGGIGHKYGFEIKRILMVPHGGWHNDTICTVEIKTNDGAKYTAKELRMTNDSKTEQIDSDAEKHDSKLISILKSLPTGFWDFVDADTREYTHGLHSYPAMMICPISRNIIKIMKSIMPIDSLLDPFCGSGTVLVEGILSGLNVVTGNDINPLALLLTKVKTTPIDINLLQSSCSKLMSEIKDEYKTHYIAIENADQNIVNQFNLDLTSKDGWGNEANKYLSEYCKENDIPIQIPNFKNLGYWFKPKVIITLQIIKDKILKIENETIRDFLFIALSETIRLVSNRRNGEFKMFRMPPHKVASFNPDVINEFEIILNRNIEKMNSFTEAYEDNDLKPVVSVYSNDAKELNDIEDNAYDLIITSPPYGDSKTTVAYGEYSRLSLQWLNLFNLSEKEIMGIDRSLMGGKKFRNGFELTLSSETLRKSLEKIKDSDIERAGDVYSFYNDLDQTIKAISAKTKTGGYQFWVVGNRTVKNELLQTDVIITELAKNYSLDHVYTIERNISNKVMPSKNSPSNESGKTADTMTNEHIVILRKR